MLMRNLIRSTESCSQGLRWCTRSISTGSSHSTQSTTPAKDADTTALELVVSPHMPYMKPYTTTLSNPAEHSEDHRTLWYTIPKEEFDTVLSSADHAVPFNYWKQVQVFREASMMIRRPAVSVISYIKQLKLNTMAPPKFMFYGAGGTGKTCSIAHVTHFLSKDGFVIVMVPWIDRILKQQQRKRPFEILQSNSVPGRWDHTRDSAEWLKFFRTQNLATLNKLQLTVTKTYEFSTRETCAEGAPLMAIVELGIARPTLSSDCIMALTVELKKLATDGRCKVALVMDGINSMFTENSTYVREDFDYYTKQKWSFIPADCFTVVQAYRGMLNNDWTNGVIVGSIDNIARKDKDRESYMPRYVLGEEGWNALDPFVPVPVPEYDDMELKSAIAYYASKHWIQKHEALTPDGVQELACLSGYNPMVLNRSCAAL